MASGSLRCFFALVVATSTTVSGQRGRNHGVIQWREKEEEHTEKSPADAYQTNSIHDPVLKLNQNIFHGNVINGADRVNNWMVLYCPYWWEPSQQISPHFEQLAGSFQERLNKDLMASHVRFARVDCATEKPLCNHYNVQDYPTVQHFKGGLLQKSWNGREQVDPDGLSKFLSNQLQQHPAGAESESVKQLTTITDFLVPGDRAFDVLLVAVLAVSFWFMSQNADPWHRSIEKHPFIVEESPASPASAVGDGADLRRRHMPRDGIENLMPQDWFPRPQDASLGMEL
jgi:hypothetical protein